VLLKGQKKKRKKMKEKKKKKKKREEPIKNSEKAKETDRTEERE